MNTKIFIILFFCYCTDHCLAQNNLLDSLILSNKYGINLEGKQFSGEGIDYIFEQSKNVQFLGLAENHNTKEIPLFTSYIFKQLHERLSFNYLALEQDPVMMKLISTRKKEVVEMAKQYLHGFTFITDQEVDLIEESLNISTKPNPIWGCDQSFGASHALNEILARFEGSEESYKKLQTIIERIYKKEKVRDLERYHYLTDTLKGGELLEVLDILKQNEATDLYQYIEPLIISDNIYTNYKNGKYYKSQSTREYYMRERFIDELKKAELIDSIPKVVLKFGHYHLMDGFNTASEVNGIGNLIRSIAQYNKQEALVINTQIYRNDNSDWDYLEDAYPQFTKHCDVNSWSLFDLRPLRSGFTNGDFKGLIQKKFNKPFKQLIYRFDLLLIVGNGGDGTWNYTKVKY